MAVRFAVQWRTTEAGNEYWKTSGYIPVNLEDARAHAKIQTRTFSNVRIMRTITEEVERVWPERERM